MLVIGELVMVHANLFSFPRSSINLRHGDPFYVHLFFLLVECLTHACVGIINFFLRGKGMGVKIVVQGGDLVFVMMVFSNF